MRKCVFVGFKKGIKGYKIWDLKDRKFIFRREVTFDKASKAYKLSAGEESGG